MSIDGTWQITIQTPMGAQQSKLEAATDGAALSGTFAAEGEIQSIYEGSIDGDTATWKVDVTKPFPLNITFTGTIAGDEMTGDAKAGMFPASPFIAERA